MNYWSSAGIPFTIAKEDVLKNVCRVFELTEKELRSRRRFRNVVDAKTALCYVLHRKNKYTSTSVGLFINLDHATILHHCRKAEQLIETDKEFLEKIKQLNIKL